jgi:hypothetical protein
VSGPSSWTNPQMISASGGRSPSFVDMRNEGGNDVSREQQGLFPLVVGWGRDSSLPTLLGVGSVLVAPSRPQGASACLTRLLGSPVDSARRVSEGASG